MTARPDVLNAAEPVRIGLGGDAITLVEGATFCRSDARPSVSAEVQIPAGASC